MKIKFIPLVWFNATEKILFEFEDDLIRIEMPDGTKDEFDFSGLPDGKLKMTETDEYGETKNLVETTLSLNVLKSARKENGELFIELLNFIDGECAEGECYPDWIDASEYEQPQIAEGIEQENNPEEVETKIDDEVKENEKT